MSSWVLVWAGATDSPESDLAWDEQALRDAGLATDGHGLLDFFRKRTPPPSQQNNLPQRIPELIRQLGAHSFRERERASAGLVTLGRAALPQLQVVLKSPDAEVARRALACIAAVHNNSEAGPVAAAARLLGDRRPAGACAALLAYLPFVTDEYAEEEILSVLAVLGMPDGKPDPALFAALRDPLPARRGAAALVLGRSRNAAQRESARRLLCDAEPRVRLRAAQGLVAARDASAVPTLVALLAEAPLDLASQAEEILGRIAASRAPRVVLGEDATSRSKCRDAWHAWWKENARTTDLAGAGADVLVASSFRRAREAALNNYQAYMRGDVAETRRTMAVPFWDGLRIHPEEGLDDSIVRAGRSFQDKGVSLRIPKVIRVTDYLGMASEGDAAFLSTYPKSEVRVVFLQLVSVNGRVENQLTVFIRITGQPQKIGYGKYQPLITVQK